MKINKEFLAGVLHALSWLVLYMEIMSLFIWIFWICCPNYSIIRLLMALVVIIIGCLIPHEMITMRSNVGVMVTHFQ